VRAGVSDRRQLQAREDGIVLVDYDKCIGCKYCAWACPYGAREIDEHQKVMKKCTLCVDRIYDQNLPEAQRKPACVLACRPVRGSTAISTIPNRWCPKRYATAAVTR